MRIRNDGQRYVQDRNAQDWPADRQTLPPITLATSNMNNAKISAEIAAGCLAGVNPAAWQHLQLAISELASALEALQFSQENDGGIR